MRRSFPFLLQALTPQRVNTLLFLFILAGSESGHAAASFSTHSLVIENRTPMQATTSVLKPDYIPPAPAGTLDSITRAEVINYLSARNSGTERYYIDGETWHVSQQLRFSISDQAALTLDLPWLKHGKGFGDRFIYHFHDVLQLPQNGRTANRHDRLLWSLEVDGQTLFRLEDQSSGLGDIRVLWQQQLEGIHNSQLGLSIKLPTGDFERQTGSEEIDLGISFAQQNPDWLQQRNFLAETPLALWYGASLSYVQANAALDAMKAKPWVLAARVGLGWQVSPRWILKTQLDANTPLFDSEIRELGWVPLMVGIASETALSATTAFDFMIIEDLRPRTSPDVVLSFGLRQRF